MKRRMSIPTDEMRDGGRILQDIKYWCFYNKCGFIY